MAEYDAATHGDMDIIFAGGGTPACVAAGRLARANPDLKILLVEGGRSSFEDPVVRTPALYMSHLAPESETAIPSKYLNGCEAIVPMGGILGGGSAINFMMYTRAQGVDFDSWNTPGWTSEDILPLCKQLETFHQDEPGIDRSRHGYNGPIHVSDGGFRARKTETLFCDTIKEMGMKEIVDLEDLNQVDGFSVVRVVFDNSNPPRATGVECKPNAKHQPSLSFSNPVKSVINAKKLVVVTAGTLGSPQILERSGVGNPDVLKRVDIPVVSNVPGVGENYQDHNIIFYPYNTTLAPEETFDGIVSGRKDVSRARAAKEPIFEAAGPAFQKCWARDYQPFPARPLILCCFINGFLGDQNLVEPGQYITLGPTTAYPYARGSIHITSADDVLEGYEFDNGFLSNPFDVKAQVWGYKMSREIARRLPFCKGELALGHPAFPTRSRAALSELSYTSVAPDDKVEYSEQDDAVIEDWIRSNVNTTWHSLGTCAMKPLAKRGVVDGNLNVHGTIGLKVADLSIGPENVGANTNGTALVIGEKAAIIIAQELGL
ncbi:hypothetical protein B7463_g4649, partial [Scytalidium lignicola]